MVFCGGAAKWMTSYGLTHSIKQIDLGSIYFYVELRKDSVVFPLKGRSVVNVAAISAAMPP